MRKIGITGGIGSGKSKVLDFLSVVRGAVICQSDLVAHQVQLPGEKCYQKVVETFGKEILNPDGTIDRKILGRIVFDQPEKLQKLNAIVHPAVNEKIREEMQKAGTRRLWQCVSGTAEFGGCHGRCCCKGDFFPKK